MPRSTTFAFFYVNRMASNGLPCPLCDAVLYDVDSFSHHVQTHRPRPNPAIVSNVPFLIIIISCVLDV